MQNKGNRRGNVFSVRVTDAERAELEALKNKHGGPRSLGAWLLWRATWPGSTRARVIPSRAARAGNTPSRGSGAVVPRRSRVILDLCAGSGAWSESYAAAGYDVRRVTLPDNDVRTYRPPLNVWGVLAAPPCTEFSLAKNGHKRDIFAGMGCVNACMRIVLQCRPKWWALENPHGLLARYLGAPALYFEPYEYGDPWTKRTCIWGEFGLPPKGPFVEPGGSHPGRNNADDWAVTPPGFARAFFDANP